MTEDKIDKVIDALAEVTSDIKLLSHVTKEMAQNQQDMINVINGSNGTKGLKTSLATLSLRVRALEMVLYGTYIAVLGILFENWEKLKHIFGK